MMHGNVPVSPVLARSHGSVEVVLVRARRTVVVVWLVGKVYVVVRVAGANLDVGFGSVIVVRKDTGDGTRPAMDSCEHPYSSSCSV